MPCWGARERLLFPHGAGETTISQRIALQSSAVHCSVVQPIQSSAEEPAAAPPPAAAAARDQALTPLQTSKEEHRATSHSCCLSLPRSTGNGKKEGENRELLSLEAA